jgi:hypothetical protein
VRDEAETVEELTDRRVLQAILGSVQYAHVKLDQILEMLREDGEEEDNEADS